MNESTEARYTLREAKRELARQECMTHGHSWDVLQNLSQGAVGIVCSTCGWTGSVTMGVRP